MAADLKALVQKWRGLVGADIYNTDASDVYRDCADELSAALRAEAGAGGFVMIEVEPTVELVAEYIYDQWKADPNFVPWTHGGNSDKQHSARSIARTVIALAQARRTDRE